MKNKKRKSSTLIGSNLIRRARFFYNFVPIDKSFLLSIVETSIFSSLTISLLFHSFCPPCCAKTIVHYNSLLICIILSTIPLTFPRLIRSITLRASYQCKDSHCRYPCNSWPASENWTILKFSFSFLFSFSSSWIIFE